MRHFKDPAFLPLYAALPTNVQRLADKNSRFSSTTRNTLLCISNAYATTFGRSASGGYRALAIEGKDGFQWFWIGSHGEYDALLR